MSDSTPDSGFIPPDPTHLADLFPGYSIVRLIACGGMGAVYEAVQIALDRAVAIKILPREFTNDESFRTGFQAEARAMARLNHPNLISVYDFGEVDGMLYIVMEYVPGFSLFQATNGQPILPEEVVPLVAAICRGLANAHDNGIIHRDIKPANILLDHRNEPKIGDFGLARPLEIQIQEGEDIFGTPGYTAPEVVEHPQSIDHRADIFSIGVLLHEMLTGLLPEADPRPASAICQCDPRFDAVIRKATHPAPAGRYNSATEIAAEIEKINTTPGPRALQTTAPAGANRRGPARKYQAPKKPTNKGALVVILLIAIGIVGYLYHQKLEANSTDTPTVETTPEVDNPKDIKIRPTPTDINLPPTPPEVDGIVQWRGAQFTWDKKTDSISFTVRSGDINGSSDSGIFKHEPWEGDGLFILEIDPDISGPSDSKAGIMIREDLEDGSRNLFLARTPNGETTLQLRALQGQETLEYVRVSTDYLFLRIQRIGDRLNAAASRDGESWSEIGSIKTPNLQKQILIGFAAASANQPSADPLSGTFYPLKSKKIDPSLDVEGAPTPRTNMNELFRRARSVMKERAESILTETQDLMKASNETYIQQSREFLNQLSDEDRRKYVPHHAEFASIIEASGFIGAQPPKEFAGISGYLEIHKTSVERQWRIQQNQTARIAELAEIYLNGVRNQIQRFTDENDPGAVKVLEAEIDRMTSLPYYFRDLMEQNE